MPELNFTELSLNEFTQRLSSRDSVPGGGGAAAMVGALAASLGAMVGNLTTGKKTYADVEEDITALIARADALRNRFLQLINEDAAAFEPLSRAYSLPKEAPGRDDYMEACLRKAADCPMEILKTCCDTVPVLEELAQKGSKMVASDAAVGAVLCQSAIYSAAINVKVNTKLMQRRDYADSVNTRTDELIREFCPRAEAVYTLIYRRYS